MTTKRQAIMMPGELYDKLNSFIEGRKMSRQRFLTVVLNYFASRKVTIDHIIAESEVLEAEQKLLILKKRQKAI